MPGNSGSFGKFRPVKLKSNFGILALNPSVLSASPTGGKDVGIPSEDAAPPMLVGTPKPEVTPPILVGTPIVCPIPLKFKLDGLDIGFVIFNLGALIDCSDKFGVWPLKKDVGAVPTLSDGDLIFRDVDPPKDGVADTLGVENDTDGALTTDKILILSSQKYSTT
jgi:hypothetical protein